MLKKVILIALIAFAVLMAGCSSGDKTPQDVDGKLLPVKVMLDWVPNTNHTGLYAALEKGWYEEEGLQVDIVQSPDGGTPQLVATGNAHFGVGYQEDITLARASGIPVVSIAAVIQHNTSGFASKKEMNITSPIDMVNKTYGGWGSPTEEAMVRAVIEGAGGDPSQVKVIDIGTSDFFTAIERDVDFTWIYYGWTGIEAEARGIDLNFMELRDLDAALDYYTPVLFTNESLIEENPDLAKKFMKATAKGYLYTAQEPAAAAQILLKHAPELDEKLVLASQEYLSPRYQDDAARWGEQKQETWENYARWMYERDLMPQMIDTEKAFTNEFLPE